jgi:hypothetical protein
MGDYTPRKLVSEVPGLSDDERRAILGRNALELIGESKRSRVSIRP